MGLSPGYRGTCMLLNTPSEISSESRRIHISGVRKKRGRIVPGFVRSSARMEMHAAWTFIESYSVT